MQAQTGPGQGDAFQALQDKLAAMWPQIGARLTADTKGQHTVVVIPSMTVDLDFTTAALKAYEERMPYMLFLLRDPDIQIVFVTSEPVQPEITDYYVQLIPGVVASHARKRLHLVSLEDGSPLPLSAKLLSRPHVIRGIRSLIPDFDQAHMVPFNTTDLERELALRLGVPMYAPDPRYFDFGTKAGCRSLFAQEGIRHPFGSGDLRSLDAVVEAVLDLKAKRPSCSQCVVKLNEGVSGQGNMLLRLETGSSPELAPALRQEIVSRGSEPDESGDTYVSRISSEGAVVEEYILASETRSPSVQLRVTPVGEVQVLSTHDQVLGGDDGQTYLGAVFPANQEYSRIITRDALKVGHRLAQEGVLGRFAIDFLVVKDEVGGWDSYAIEINLRKGGTTAPYLITQFLTDGRYDPDAGLFVTADDLPRYYVASDHVEAEAYRVFNTTQVLDLVSAHRLHYSHSGQTGVVLHMMSDVGEHGRLGATAIGRSPEDARRIFDDFNAVLTKEADRLLQS
jgi:pheganomycin biosynthesis PGM1-like protein